MSCTTTTTKTTSNGGSTSPNYSCFAVFNVKRLVRTGSVSKSRFLSLVEEVLTEDERMDIFWRGIDSYCKDKQDYNTYNRISHQLISTTSRPKFETTRSGELDNKFEAVFDIQTLVPLIFAYLDLHSVIKCGMVCLSWFYHSMSPTSVYHLNVKDLVTTRTKTIASESDTSNTTTQTTVQVCQDFARFSKVESIAVAPGGRQTYKVIKTLFNQNSSRIRRLVVNSRNLTAGDTGLSSCWVQMPKLQILEVTAAANFDVSKFGTHQLSKLVLNDCLVNVEKCALGELKHLSLTSSKYVPVGRLKSFFSQLLRVGGQQRQLSKLRTLECTVPRNSSCFGNFIDKFAKSNTAGTRCMQSLKFEVRHDFRIDCKHGRRFASLKHVEMTVYSDVTRHNIKSAFNIFTFDYCDEIINVEDNGIESLHIMDGVTDLAGLDLIKSDTIDTPETEVKNEAASADATDETDVLDGGTGNNDETINWSDGEDADWSDVAIETDESINQSLMDADKRKNMLQCNIETLTVNVGDVWSKWKEKIQNGYPFLLKLFSYHLNKMALNNLYRLKVCANKNLVVNSWKYLISLLIELSEFENVNQRTGPEQEKLLIEIEDIWMNDEIEPTKSEMMTLADLIYKLSIKGSLMLRIVFGHPSDKVKLGESQSLEILEDTKWVKHLTSIMSCRVVRSNSRFPQISMRNHQIDIVVNVN